MSKPGGVYLLWMKFKRSESSPLRQTERGPAFVMLQEMRTFRLPDFCRHCELDLCLMTGFDNIGTSGLTRLRRKKLRPQRPTFLAFL